MWDRPTQPWAQPCSAAWGKPHGVSHPEADPGLAFALLWHYLHFATYHCYLSYILTAVLHITSFAIASRVDVESLQPVHTKREVNQASQKGGRGVSTFENKALFATPSEYNKPQIKPTADT